MSIDVLSELVYQVFTKFLWSLNWAQDNLTVESFKRDRSVEVLGKCWEFLKAIGDDYLWVENILHDEPVNYAQNFASELEKIVGWVVLSSQVVNFESL